MIPIVSGSVLDASEDIICQQVNCRGVMGKGLGLQIRVKYPEVYYTYLIHCQKNKYSKNLLNTVLFVNTRNNKTIANIFSQYDYGTNKRYTDYDALKEGLQLIKSKNKSIAIPYGMGCGLGGGNWDTVYDIINDVFGDSDSVKIYKYEK